jgi:hypothetical protein
MSIPHVFAAPTSRAETTASYADSPSISDRILARAFRTGRSEFPIRCKGRVTRLLSDDTDGIRHQRFILRLSTGQTLLIVHNIDLAPRIRALKVSDRVIVKGEYIWNELGGLIHYTHRDPDGEGFHGYIRHKKHLYR